MSEILELNFSKMTDHTLDFTRINIMHWFHFINVSAADASSPLAACTILICLAACLSGKLSRRTLFGSTVSAEMSWLSMSGL